MTKWLTVEEAIAEFGVKRSTLCHACGDGRVIGAINLGRGPGLGYRIPKAAMLEWVAIHRAHINRPLVHNRTGYRRGCTCPECVTGAKAADKADRLKNLEQTRERDRLYKRQLRERDPERCREIERCFRARNPNREHLRRRFRKLDAAIANPRTGPWSKDEDQAVLREDISLLEIACLLQRKPSAVRYRRAYLRRREQWIADVVRWRRERMDRMSPDRSKGGKRWTAADLAIARDPTLTLQQKCARLQRSTRAVEYAISKGTVQ